MKGNAARDRVSISVESGIANQIATESAKNPRDQILLAIDDLSEGFALFDVDDRMVFCNRRYREINCSAADAIAVGSRFEEQQYAFVCEGLVPEAVGQEVQWLAERMDRHRDPRDTFEHQHRDGSWIQVREHRLPDGVTSVFNLDITRQKSAETEFNTLATRFETVAKIAKFGYWARDEIEDRYEYLSPEYARILGRTVDDLNENFGGWEADIQLVHPDDREKWTRSETEWSKSPEDWDVEYRLIRPDGEIRYIHEIGEAILDVDGKLVRTVGTAQDITELKMVETALREAEARLERRVAERTDQLSKLNLELVLEVRKRMLADEARQASERKFRDFAESATDWFWEMDAELRFSYHSERYFEITGTHPGDPVELPNLPSANPVLGSKGASSHKPLGVYLEGRLPFKSFEYGFTAPDGSMRYARISGTPIYDGQSRFLGYRGTGTDITQTHKLSLDLAYQASHDPLTGLINRRVFGERLEHLIESAKRKRCEHALCYIDLDQFKVINDTCGHLAGDQLLQQLSVLLKKHVRHRDSVARLGGDEFGVLMEHCSMEQAGLVANGLREVVEAFRLVWLGKTFRVAASIGLVPLDANSGNAEEMLSAADSACYLAKEKGRNRVHVHRQNDEDLDRRQGEMQWVARIDQALEQGRFELFSQPIQCIGAAPDGGRRLELLLRLRDEQGLVVLPEVFLPAARRYDLSVRIDQWVVDNAFEWLVVGAGDTARLESCAINLSGTSIADESFLEFIIQRLDSVEVPAHKICFEITETAVVANLARAVRFVEELTARGCQFALDDFGSGLSSFTFLKNLSVDFIKIDQTFVEGIDDDPIDLAMVRSINDIGHVMGKQTIAEGVESEAVLERLREIGVDYAQGFAIGSPAPIDWRGGSDR